MTQQHLPRSVLQLIRVQQSSSFGTSSSVKALEIWEVNSSPVAKIITLQPRIIKNCFHCMKQGWVFLHNPGPQICRAVLLYHNLPLWSTSNCIEKKNLYWNTEKCRENASLFLLASYLYDLCYLWPLNTASFNPEFIYQHRTVHLLISMHQKWEISTPILQHTSLSSRGPIQILQHVPRGHCLSPETLLCW